MVDAVPTEVVCVSTMAITAHGITRCRSNAFLCSVHQRTLHSHTLRLAQYPDIAFKIQLYPTPIPTTLAGNSNANECEMYGFTGGWGGVRYGRRGVDRWGVLRMLRGDWTSQPALEEHVALRL